MIAAESASNRLDRSGRWHRPADDENGVNKTELVMARDRVEVKREWSYEMRCATFHEIAGRASAWSEYTVRLWNLVTDQPFIMLARNDILNKKHTLFLKCHRGRGTKPAIPLK